MISSKRIRLMGQQQYEGILDTLGIAGNMVLGFSPYRLAAGYEGYCLRVRRSSDDEELDIGFDSNGYIDVVTLESFCSGTDGFISIWYNQYTSGNNALRTTNGYQPQIVSGGSLLSNGLKFDSTDDYMSVVDYAEIQITSFPLTTYCNYYNNSAYNGFLFNKFIGTSTYNIQYGLQSITIACRSFLCGNFGRIIPSCGHNVTGLNQTMLSWQGTGSNQFELKSVIDHANVTINGTLNNYSSFTIGSWGLSNYSDANIKTLLVFNSDEYSNYNNFVNAGI